MHYKYICFHEVKNQRALAKRTSQIMINGQDVKIQMGSGTRCSRLNIPCLMHDTRLCQYK